jgi:hypothetical protein
MKLRGELRELLFGTGGVSSARSAAWPLAETTGYSLAAMNCRASAQKHQRNFSGIGHTDQPPSNSRRYHQFFPNPATQGWVAPGSLLQLVQHFFVRAKEKQGRAQT